jgi:hypothetical protein
MATVSDSSGDTGLSGEPAGNRKWIFIFIAGAVLLLIIFAFLASSFMSSDSSAGEEPRSQPEDTRARP